MKHGTEPITARSPAILAMQDMALFVEVASALSFTRASERSGVPIATLSRRISRLEKRVGIRLLTRTTRRITLTEAGQRYAQRCERIVQEAAIAQDVLKDAAERPAGHLRISMPVEFGVSYIAPIVDEFARQFPEVTLDLDLSPRTTNFSAEKVDASIRLGAITEKSLVVRRLGSAARVLYAAPSYLGARGVPRRPEDLAQHDCILQSYMTHPANWELISGKRSIDVRVRGRFSTNNVSMTLRLTEQGHGIAVLAPALAHAAYARGTIRRVLDDWSFPKMPVHIVMASSLVPARLRAFIDFLASRFIAQLE
jgi:DNA-binding transcriptional LysR family regulator